MKNTITLSITLIVLLIFTSACSIKQTVQPANLSYDQKICIEDNPKVKDGFLLSIQNSLEEKNIAYKIIERYAERPECEWKITYTANWAWDLAVYMTYARINIYHNDKPKGYAEYDARSGGGRLDKFIDAEQKVRELMQQLLQEKYAYLTSEKIML